MRKTHDLCLTVSGPISQKMYAVLPCGGIGVRLLLRHTCLTHLRLCIVCASSIHFMLPSAGWQRHCVERNALILGSPYGGRLCHWACLQSGSRGTKGNPWPTDFWKLTWVLTDSFSSKKCQILKMPHQATNAAYLLWFHLLLFYHNWLMQSPFCISYSIY